jgi:hypothetical protein
VLNKRALAPGVASGGPASVDPGSEDLASEDAEVAWGSPGASHFHANVALFKQLSAVFIRSTSSAGGTGGAGVGMPGTLDAPSAFLVLSRLLADGFLEDHGRVLVDCGVGDGRMLMLAAALLRPHPIRLIGVDFCENSMRCGVGLCSPDRNGYYHDAIMPHGDADPLGDVSVEWFHGIFTPVASLGQSRQGLARRVESLAGATHVMAMWEGWHPDDQAELLELVKQATSIKVACFVQAWARGLDLANATEGWASLEGPARVRLAGGRTTLRAYWLSKTGGTRLAARDGDSRTSLLSWPQWVPAPERQTRASVQAMAQVPGV